MHGGDGLVPALDLRKVAKLYGSTPALRATTLCLNPGEALALLGPNGSGKTTLLRIIAGAITPTLGEGTILGCNLRGDRRPLRKNVGMLASETYLYDDLSARENLRFYSTMTGSEAPRSVMDEVLAQVGLTPHADDRVRNFSSGMKRRLSIGRLLLQDPELVLLDEPYNSLDAAASDLVDTMISRRRAGQRTVVVATHDAERALALVDRVALLERGTVRFFGPVEAYRGRGDGG